jgi:hypothetical protein
MGLTPKDFAMPETKIDIAEIKARLKPLLDAEERARKISPIVPKARMFVAMIGSGLEFSSLEILSDFVSIRSVTNPPDPIHIRRAADLQHVDFLMASRYSFGVTAELAIGNPKKKEHSEESFLLGFARHIAALLKIRGHTSLYFPIAATVSWDTISAVKDNSVAFRFLHDICPQIVYDREPPKVTSEDITWIASNWETALNLRNQGTSRRFGLAFDIAYKWNHTRNSRIAFANVWCGLEALFGTRSGNPPVDDLAERIHGWLPSITQSEVRKLYRLRCNAIYGRFVAEDEIGPGLRTSEDILRQALIKCIETNRKTLPDEHDFPIMKTD